MLLPSLYYIISENQFEKSVSLALCACKNGCKLIQLRMKHTEHNLFLKTAIEIKKICNDYNTIFIINDNVSVAKEVRANGVHIGKEDMRINEARLMLGNDSILGYTVNSMDDVEDAISEKVDYIGLGPYRYTDTKEKLSEIIGIEGIREIVRRIKKSQLPNLPVYAIGGIGLDDVKTAFETGISGICISSFISKSIHPDITMKSLLHEIKKFKNE